MYDLNHISQEYLFTNYLRGCKGTIAVGKLSYSLILNALCTSAYNGDNL